MTDTPTLKILIGDEFSPAACQLISEARHSIKIIVFDWRVSFSGDLFVDAFNNSLSVASKRGVEVKAIVNSEPLKKDLLYLGIKARKIITKKLVHAKVLLVDGKTAIIGSHNYTTSGFGANIEISVLVDLGDEGKRLEQYFDRLFGI